MLRPLAEISFKVWFNGKFFHVIWSKRYDEATIAWWLLKKLNKDYDVKIETYYMESFVKEQTWAKNSKLK